jgi:hypothetical protein
LLDQCKRCNVSVKPPESIEGFLRQLKSISDNKQKALNLLNDEIQQDIKAQEEFVRQQNEQIKKAERSLISQTDCLSVLNVAQKMLPQLSVQMTGNLGDGESENEQVSLISDGNANQITTIAGICSAEEIVRLRRLIFRASRGQAFVYIEEVEPEDD